MSGSLDLSELGSVFIVLGFSEVMLFSGESTTEMVLLDPETGEDFTIPVPRESLMELTRRRGGILVVADEGDGYGEDEEPAPEKAPTGGVVRAGVGSTLEADQF